MVLSSVLETLDYTYTMIFFLMKSLFGRGMVRNKKYLFKYWRSEILSFVAFNFFSLNMTIF